MYGLHGRTREMCYPARYEKGGFLLLFGGSRAAGISSLREGGPGGLFLPVSADRKIQEIAADTLPAEAGGGALWPFHDTDALDHDPFPRRGIRRCSAALRTSSAPGGPGWSGVTFTPELHAEEANDLLWRASAGICYRLTRTRTCPDYASTRPQRPNGVGNCLWAGYILRACARPAEADAPSDPEQPPAAIDVLRFRELRRRALLPRGSCGTPLPRLTRAALTRRRRPSAPGAVAAFCRAGTRHQLWYFFFVAGGGGEGARDAKALSGCLSGIDSRPHGGSGRSAGWRPGGAPAGRSFISLAATLGTGTGRFACEVWLDADIAAYCILPAGPPRERLRPLGPPPVHEP
jgi:hypothetical protein